MQKTLYVTRLSSNIQPIYKQISESGIKCYLFSDIDKTEINSICIVSNEEIKNTDTSLFDKFIDVVPEKKAALIIYHGDNFEELGMLSDEIEWSLEDKSTIKERKEANNKEKKEPKAITCKECQYVYKSSRKCPQCGYQMIADSEAIPCHEQDLVEIKPDKDTPADKKQFYAMLLWIVRKRGYKRGWGDWKFKEKFGHFPKTKNGIEPIPPDEKMQGYLKYLDIKRAKSR